MGKVIITNSKWFKKYLTIRKIILFMVLLSILIMLKPEIISIYLKGAIQTVSISLLITLRIFNFIQKPSFFELQRKENELRVGLYLPDTRYSINFSKNKIKYFNIGVNDKVFFEFKAHFIPLLNKGDIKVRKENGEMIHFEILDFSWASQSDLELLNKAFSEHNTA